VTRGWIVDRPSSPVLEHLSELSGSELSSVLIEVMQRHAATRSPADTLAQYERDRFCAPAAVDQRTSVEVDGHLLAAAADFEAIELSPVAPLATCSSVAPTHQNRVLSALRSTEVVADPTNVLALECARRLRTAAGPVHLATTQRVIRAQPIPRLPGYAAHFRIFVLASGGIEAKDHAFTADTFERHIRTMLAALDRLERHGYAFGVRRIDILATPQRAAVADRIATVLGAAAPSGTAIQRKPLEHPYYSSGMRYMLWVTPPDGGELPLIDGGCFDWLAKLTSNRRAVYVASGAGAQLIPIRFRIG
jgi:hypothetical protein